MHARRWPLWIVYLLICFPTIIISAFPDVNSEVKIDVLLTVFSHLLSAFLYYAVLKMEIQIYSDVLIYKNMIKTKKIEWKK